ncbi:MAG: MFS transporter [Verrucomicrobiota bacterium]
MSSSASTAETTYRLDCGRSVFHGICEAGWVTFGLLIIIRYYEADAAMWSDTFAKSLIASAGFIGLLLTTFSTNWVSRRGWPATKVIGGYLVVAGLLLVLTASIENVTVFVITFVLANIISSQQAPLMTATYASNYNAQERGKRVALALAIVAASSACFAWGGGWLLDQNFEQYPVLLLVMVGACWVNGAIVSRIPSQPIPRQESESAWGALSWIWKDQLFGWLLSAKMLMGLANLMTLPIRVEILANPQYGIDASNMEVVLAAVVIPSVVRILSSKFFGVCFDRWNYVVWRVLVNSCFIIGILLYFTSESLGWIYLGAAFVGMGMGGGAISWNLWVTKITKPENAAAYMSVHTTLTGIRGVIAPFLGYMILHACTSRGLAMICVGAIVVSTLIYCALWKSPRLRNGNHVEAA